MDISKVIQNNLQMHSTARTVDTSGLFGAIEQGFRNLGLNTPLMRSTFLGAVAAGALFVIQPDFAFQDGVPRPWTPMLSEEAAGSSKVAPTMAPWWLVSFFAGVASGLFI